jgi:hypothetical protein
MIQRRPQNATIKTKAYTFTILHNFFVIFLVLFSNNNIYFIQERVRRKLALEENIKQTSARLERAQLLSYSLEEECKRWKQVKHYSLLHIIKSD